MSGLVVRREGDVVTLLVDRPEAMNAIDRATMDALERAVAALEGDEALACVIVAAEGPCFVAGGDIKDLSLMPTAAEGRAMALRMDALLERLGALPCPVVAAIDGDAFGGGCEIALACDVRIMARGAHLRFKQIAMGVTPGWGGGHRLVERVGAGRALWLLSTAASIDADDALALGLVDLVTEPGGARAEAERGADRIAAAPRATVHATKRLVRAARPATATPEARDLEAGIFGETWASEAHAEAVARFLSRRR